MFELVLLIAVAYAGARGVEKITGADRAYDTPQARQAVRKLAADGPKDGAVSLVKRPRPTEPGGTFSAAAPRSAKVGGTAAYPLAVITETGATMWKAVGEGYRERWPEIRAEHRRKMIEKAQARRRKKDQAAAEKKAAAAKAQAGPPPLYPPMPTEPPKAAAPGTPEQPTTPPAPAAGDGTPDFRPGGPDLDAPTDQTARERDAADAQADQARQVAAEAKPTDPEPAAGRRHLTVVPGPAPSPDPAENGDPMSSPATVIPEIRTLDSLLNALILTKAMCEMRAEEALAIATDDKALSDRLDQIETELAALEVDPATRAEIDTLRESIHAQSQAAATYGAAAKDAGDLAAAAATAAHKAHGGIAEAVQSSPIEVAAQAGYYEH